ncbi:MAG: hypothetical protein MUF29_06370 [Chitinophagaceae bacterium]|nr:hypothetical protein [Chitinophagaceae bacterium]
MCVMAAVAVVGWNSCSQEQEATEGYLHKDLSEQMDALAVYQGGIGEELRQGRTDNALWLLDGLDSVLLLMTSRLNEHHNLKRPFEYYYEKKLKTTVGALRTAVTAGDTTEAQRQYRLLVMKCNSCHNEHEVEERAHY